MSSLYQDRLLPEGSEPASGSAPTLAPARATSRTPAAEKVTSTVPTQRLGTAQREETTQTTTTEQSPRARTRRTSTAKTAGTLAARAKAAGTATRKVATAKAATVKVATAKAATVKVATAKATTGKVATAKVATVKAATVKPAATKAATAKAATVKAATVKAAATKPAVAKPAVAKPATTKPAAGKPATAKAATAKPAVAKPVTVKASASKATAAKPVPAEAATPAVTTPPVGAVAPVQVRPTPHKRTVPADQILAALAEQSGTPAATTRASLEATESRVSAFLRRRPPSISRRPSLYLAAALICALGVSGFTTDGPAAQATDTVSHSVSVAEELGIEATPVEAITETDATQLLGDLAASRSVRDAEQAAAAQVQVQADQAAAAAAAAAAAEAARPKAVLPVDGARLTSGFGARWGTLHAGIDLAAPMQTPEFAVMDGVVLEAGPASGFGLAVYIQHENGDVTVYGHMDSILVDAGQVVRAGDTIALLGNRGQSTGPHLHFEVHVGGLDGTKTDPLPWLRERGVQI